tara:strand:- start:105 stop:1031 length:927 start_codon:yes stop_codon:yes gene_type:complete
MKIIAITLLPISFLRFNARFFQAFELNNIFSFFYLSAIPLFDLIFFTIFYNIGFEINVGAISRGFSILISSTLSFIFLFIIISKKNIGIKFKAFDVSKKLKILNDSIYYMLSSIFFIIIINLNVLMLSGMTDLVSVGVYSIAVRIAAYLSLFLSTIYFIYSPKFAKLWGENNITKLKLEYHNSTRAAFIPTIICAILLILFRNEVLMIFGQEFSSASISLCILILSASISAFLGPVNALLDMTNNQKIVQKNIFISLIINFILNLFLIPRLGIEGAALSTLIAVLYYHIAGIIFIRNKFKFSNFIFDS